MPSVGVFPDVGPHQEQTFGVDFGSFLEPTISLTGTPSLNLTTGYGSGDSTPSSRVLGGPNVGTISPELGGSGATNAAILFKIGTCIVGTTYFGALWCATTSGDIVEAWFKFRCVGPQTGV